MRSKPIDGKLSSVELGIIPFFRTHIVFPSQPSEIERLRLELAALNERIEELEKQHPEASKIEALRESALVLAGQIAEIRCSSTNDLTDLLAK